LNIWAPSDEFNAPKNTKEIFEVIQKTFSPTTFDYTPEDKETWAFFQIICLDMFTLQRVSLVASTIKLSLAKSPDNILLVKLPEDQTEKSLSSKTLNIPFELIQSA